MPHNVCIIIIIMQQKITMERQQNKYMLKVMKVRI